MSTRIALFWGNLQSRKYAEERFAQMEGLEVVFKGNSYRKQLKLLLNSRPDVIVVSPGEGNMHISQIDPTFKKIRIKIPQARIILHTELSFDDPFVLRAERSGISIVDNRLDYGQLALGINKVAEGEQIALFAGKSHNLETFRRNPGKEAF